MAHICLFLNLKSNFASIYLQDYPNRYYIRIFLAFLWHFSVVIPDESNLSISEHTFKSPYEVFRLLKIKIFIFSNKRRIGLSKINFLFIIWPLILEETIIEFDQFSLKRLNTHFSSRPKKISKKVSSSIIFVLITRVL
jgi:hypothetical protein